MKKYIAIVIATLAITNNAFAIKTDPVLSNPKDKFSIKTDPVLSNPKDMFAIKTDPVLSNPLDKFFIKTDPVLKPNLENYSVNLEPVMELLSALEEKGVKVESKLTESSDISILEIKLDGQSISPVVLECKNCGGEF